jgi:hypothetical protein
MSGRPAATAAHIVSAAPVVASAGSVAVRAQGGW